MCYWWYIGGRLVVDDVVWEVYYFYNSLFKMLIALLFLKHIEMKRKKNVITLPVPVTVTN